MYEIEIRIGAGGGKKKGGRKGIQKRYLIYCSVLLRLQLAIED
jgi:hypothetical protein